MRVRARACMHWHVCMHACTCTHTHTYIHTFPNNNLELGREREHLRHELWLQTVSSGKVIAPVAEGVCAKGLQQGHDVAVIVPPQVPPAPVGIRV